MSSETNTTHVESNATVSREMDKVNAEDRLRLYVTDPNTFEFSFDDAEALAEELDALHGYRNELLKIAADLGEPDDPFAAWEALAALRSKPVASGGCGVCHGTGIEYDSAFGEIQELPCHACSQNVQKDEVQVKPLGPWRRGYCDERVTIEQISFGGLYQVRVLDGVVNVDWPDHREPTVFPTVEEAKAAAEADYRNRIMSTLLPKATAPVVSEPAYWHNGMGQMLSADALAMQDQETASRFCHPLYASPQPQPVAVTEEWKPIDTAPKTPSEILLWGVMKGRTQPWKYIGSWFPHRDGGWWVAHAMPVEPTHWMPLPPPPAALQAALEHPHG